MKAETYAASGLVIIQAPCKCVNGCGFDSVFLQISARYGVDVAYDKKKVFETPTLTNEYEEQLLESYETIYWENYPTSMRQKINKPQFQQEEMENLITTFFKCSSKLRISKGNNVE